MATLLAHIQVKPGREAEFEAIAATLHRETHAREPDCLRYEYWRGAEPGRYYALLSFRDFHAFVRHQLSEHHEAASPRIGSVCASVRLEWVDPVGVASELPPTRMRAIPAGADAKTARTYELFAAVEQAWWPRDGTSPA